MSRIKLTKLSTSGSKLFEPSVRKLKGREHIVAPPLGRGRQG
jgi:hypothetical protein